MSPYISFNRYSIAGKVAHLNSEGQKFYSEKSVKDYLNQDETLEREQDTFYYQEGNYTVRCQIIFNHDQKWDAICELVPCVGY